MASEINTEINSTSTEYKVHQLREFMGNEVIPFYECKDKKIRTFRANDQEDRRMRLDEIVERFTFEQIKYLCEFQEINPDGRYPTYEACGIPKMNGQDYKACMATVERLILNDPFKSI